ncbi:MAG: response regulator [Planctomycetaceae bacterium]|nr:response regulator [Planctomycetaceae bacterium]
MRILVVDDIGYSRLFHARLLQRLGHETIMAVDGREAMSILRRDPTIDAVLTDMLMTGIDGLELYRQCQSIERLDDTGNSLSIPFLLMTAARPGSAQQKDLERINVAKQLGFSDVLFKPITADDLERAVKKLTQVKSEDEQDPSEIRAEVRATIGRLVQRFGKQNRDLVVEAIHESLAEEGITAATRN